MMSTTIGTHGFTSGLKTLFGEPGQISPKLAQQNERIVTH